jgi:hypothetical protein
MTAFLSVALRRAGEIPALESMLVDVLRERSFDATYALPGRT